MEFLKTNRPIRKKYYRIGEVCDMLCENASCIRFWLDEFGMKPRRDGHRNRMIENIDLAKLMTVQSLLREQGYTIKGAKKQLENHKIVFDEVINNYTDVLTSKIIKMATKTA